MSVEVYKRSLKIVQHDIIVMLMVFLVLMFRRFLVGWFHYTYMNNIESPIGYVACFLTLSCDVLSVICRLHNLWSPFKIPFYLVLPIVFSFRAHAFYYLGTIRRFSWNDTKVSHWRFHDNRIMNTSADVSKFKILPFHV
jgi:hypothetical protein